VQAEYGQVHATGKKSNLSADEDLLLQVMRVQAEQHKQDFPNLKQ
jgi:hypothetical protein